MAIIETVKYRSEDAMGNEHKGFLDIIIHV